VAAAAAGFVSVAAMTAVAAMVTVAATASTVIALYQHPAGVTAAAPTEGADVDVVYAAIEKDRERESVKIRPILKSLNFESQPPPSLHEMHHSQDQPESNFFFEGFLRAGSAKSKYG
jgi:hypothetical protein